MGKHHLERHHLGHTKRRGVTRQSPVPSLGTWTGDSSGKREGPVEESNELSVDLQNVDANNFH